MQSLAIIIGVITIGWLFLLTWYLYKLHSHYNKLTSGVDQGNLEIILARILNKSDGNADEIEEIKNKIKQIIANSVYNISKVGILRFNPFADTGGDQSFILTILDKTNSGIVLTSLHNRGMTRWYAKNIKDSKGDGYELSDEELKAIHLLTKPS